MTYLENSKQYTGSDLENIFFRPMLTGVLEPYMKGGKIGLFGGAG